MLTSHYSKNTLKEKQQGMPARGGGMPARGGDARPGGGCPPGGGDKNENEKKKILRIKNCLFSLFPLNSKCKISIRSGANILKGFKNFKNQTKKSKKTENDKKNVTHSEILLIPCRSLKRPCYSSNRNQEKSGTR